MANLGPQYQNLTYGSLLQVPGGVTDQLQVVTDGNGNNTGLLISSTGISIPGLVTTNAQNLNGGSIGSLPYQSGVSTTSFVSAGTPGQVLLSSGSSAPFWANSVPTALLKAGDTMTGTLSMGANNITNLATPVLATDAATKNYVDSVAVGINVKTSCAAATTANITLSGAQTIDGVSVVAGNRVLVKNQTAPADNGIYVASASAWTRATDADTWAELIGAMVFISAGTINGLTSWISNTTSGGTIGVTAVTFVQFGASQSYTAGTGITLSGNQFSLTTPVTVSSGGTGVSSLTGVPWGNGGSAMTVATGAQLSGQMAGVGAANQLLQSNGASAPTWTSTPRGTSFQFNGSISNSVTINAGTSPASQTYSLPATYPSVSGQVLSSTTGGAMSWASVATTSGQSILAGNNSGGFQNVTLSGLSYNTSTSTLSVTSSSSIVFDVTTYGASSGASAATNTSSINAAITAAGNAGGGIVFFPAGQYQINAELLCSQSCVTLQGVSSGDADTARGSKIIQTSTSAAIIHVTANYVAIDSLCLQYQTAPGSSGYGIYCQGHNCTFTNFTVVNAYIGLYALVARTIFASKFIMTLCGFSALTIEGSGTDSNPATGLAYGVFTDFIVSASTSGGTGGLVRLYNKVEGSQFVNGQTLNGSLSLYMGAGATNQTLGLVPAYNQFTNCVFDSATGVAGGGNASYIAVTYETQMVGCWFSGGVYSGTPAGGLYLNKAFVLRMTGCSFFNNGTNGCTLSAASRHVSFDNCTFESNNRIAGSGTGYGLAVASGTNYFQVTNCFAGADNTFNAGQTQIYGVYISGGCNNFIVANNDCTGNVTGGVYNGSGTSGTQIVSQNLG